MRVGRWAGKSAHHISRGAGRGRKSESLPIDVAEKELLSDELSATVPQTDSGGRGEYPQVFERILVKELGKMTP